MRILIALTIVLFISQARGETFFPLPELSESCSIEVDDYEKKVKKEVQGYVSGIHFDNVKSLISIRRLVISEGEYTVQQNVDTELYGRLSFLIGKSSISERGIELLKAIRNELLTYPLAISESNKILLDEQFKAIGM